MTEGVEVDGGFRELVFADWFAAGVADEGLVDAAVRFADG